MPDWPFFGYILGNVFGDISNSADLSDRLARVITISVEHRKNDEILFQNVFGHRESVNLRVRVMLITYCFLRLFCFMGTLARRRKT